MLAKYYNYERLQSIIVTEIQNSIIWAMHYVCTKMLWKSKGQNPNVVTHSSLSNNQNGTTTFFLYYIPKGESITTNLISINHTVSPLPY